MAAAATTTTVEAKVAPRSAPKVSGVAQFATAGLGGVLGWIVIHPFNTVAVRMNLSTGKGEKSFIKFTRKIVKDEGFKTLYKGLGAGITRQIFYATSRFGLFEIFRDQMAKYRETDFLSRLVVGVASGACAAVVSCPAEVSLVRMSNDLALPPERRRNYTSVANAAKRIVTEEGVTTFWRGSQPLMIRAALVGATQVGTYDQFRDTFRKLGLKDETTNVLASSSAAGLLYSLITMPFETAKNKMSSQQRDPVTGQLPYKSTVQTIKSVAASDGVVSLWKGFLPYYGRCGGHTVCMFFAVEKLRSLYIKYVLT
mmetsp:Transcript_21560/g.37107  ORF Transcript_21560/g.37107 Transcript_21560/m.37107 type:complete len:312 (+) Transcript_21560:153-1088(+)|eukprot:CAMPEP_0184692462 /NCGR_PEP_ID=MMETSP0313-20130426/935_1 /TAXON_ID=2792 /ORGANISM="Porphyridium aerugineum, Strain SAG 1380-2" /LENGTH=311 /DNA_ID=CAMNT_0027150297 /DNA_START=139 /DNA_END=1074 /DNA_ORIENTATION=-